MDFRKIVIIVVAVVLVVGYAMLGTGYLKERSRGQTLGSQIADATESLAQIPPYPADLNSRLTSANLSLLATKASLPQILNTTGIVDTVLHLAEDTGVKAIPLVTQPWKVEIFDDQNYAVFRMNLTVSGTYATMADFLEHLELVKFTTLIIEQLSVEYSLVVTETMDDPGSTEVSAIVDFAIYARPPGLEG